MLCLAGVSEARKPMYHPPFQIVEIARLDFGAVLDAPGLITIAPDSGELRDPSAIHLGGYHGPGEYEFLGEPYLVFTLEVIPFGGPGLRLEDMKTSVREASVLQMQMDATGREAIQIGGSLEVNPEEAAAGMDQPLHFIVSISFE
jgi:hypothetical protein